MNTDTSNGEAIAIVGAAGRFPGAASVREFWELLRAGASPARHASRSELQSLGVSRELLDHPRFVPVSLPFHDACMFDARFFGYSPKQAASLDPQQRVLLECAWHALEDSGHLPEKFRGRIGVFAGSGASLRLLGRFKELRGWNGGDSLQTLLDGDKDHLSTRISYKLNLSGPSLSVQTACSTSLVAVHLACQSLLTFESDLCLAGGASVQVPQAHGYVYEEGSILSSDGICRPFDDQATGTIGANGACLVVLKRLSDALADDDSVLAVILGSAVNNDGANKVAYTAPSLEAQVNLLRAAQLVAGVSAADISFVETHGTGTRMGDAIEVGALAKIFDSDAGTDRPCYLGSLKANFGHLDTASGVCGLLKTALSLKHRELVPQINVRTPLAPIGGTHSRLQLSFEHHREWPCAEGQVRIAGVSSFGMGGTNAHVILREPPACRAVGKPAGPAVICLSARSPAAVVAAAENLRAALEAPDATVDIHDVARTLQVGRREFSHRWTAVAHSIADLKVQLDRASTAGEGTPVERETVFMFPGQGTPCLGALRHLHPIDGDIVADAERCMTIVERVLGVDLRPQLLDDSTAELAQVSTVIAQPLTFVTSYCLARHCMRTGLTPAAMVGHSLGELTAACLADVFDLDTALAIVCRRAELMDRSPSGGMIAAQLSKRTAAEFLSPGVSLAAINGPDRVVFSGGLAELETLQAKLVAAQVAFQRLRVAHAFHSGQMIEAADELCSEFATLQAREPAIPLVSCVSADYATRRSMSDPDYLRAQMLAAVRFNDAITVLAGRRPALFVEVGMGQQLCGLARLTFAGRDEHRVLPIAPDAAPVTGHRLSEVLARAWQAGATIRYEESAAMQRGRRVSLPGYPFERSTHDIERSTAESRPPGSAEDERTDCIDHWFYVPVWRTLPVIAPREPEGHSVRGLGWLVFGDLQGAAEAVVDHLHALGASVVTARRAATFQRNDSERFSLDPTSSDQVTRLWRELLAGGVQIDVVVHCCAVSERPIAATSPAFEATHEAAFVALLNFVKAHELQQPNRPLRIATVTNGVFRIGTDPGAVPGGSILHALGTVVAQELPAITCSVVDIPGSAFQGDAVSHVAGISSAVINSCTASNAERLAALRGAHSFSVEYERVALPKAEERTPVFRRGALYLISGGLGRVGSTLARHLIEQNARVLVLGRPRPPRATPASTGSSVSQPWRSGPGVHDSLMVVEADIADEASVRGAIEAAERRFGPLRGVFHLAADTKTTSFRRSVMDLELSDLQAQAAAKVLGYRALDRAIARRALDFAVVFSSTAAVLGGIGFGAYAAVNACVDSLALESQHGGRPRWLAINWDGILGPAESGAPSARFAADRYSLESSEFIEALERALSGYSGGQLVVCAGNFRRRYDRWVRGSNVRQGGHAAVSGGPAHAADNDTRTNAVGNGAPPPAASKGAPTPAFGNGSGKPALGERAAIEHRVADAWRELLGVSDFAVDIDFRDLGGDSLSSVRLRTRLQAMFDVQLPLEVLMGAQLTVATLSAEIERRMREAPRISALPPSR